MMKMLTTVSALSLRPSTCLRCTTTALINRRHSTHTTSIPSSSNAQPQPPPLTGLKVLDLTRVLAGPYCTMMLGDLGADVIKVENPGTGDETRAWGPPFKDPVKPNAVRESAYFLGVNRNKRSITVNFKHPKGLEIVKRLASEADILVENYIPGKLAEIGLGYEVLSRTNPGLIYASISGYGQQSTRPGYDLIVEAEGGLMHITGEPTGPPLKVGVAITDLMTGSMTIGSILAALYARTQTGRGQWLDISLFDTQLSALANIGHNYLIGGKEAKRQGNAHTSIVPYQAFETQDGHMVVSAGNDRQFASLCKALGIPHIAQDPKFVTNADRVANREELVAILNGLFRTKPTETWERELAKTGCPLSGINNLEKAFARPQVKERDMVVEVEHATVGKVKLVGIPIKYSETKPCIRLPPPTLGQHTKQILKELGYSEEDVRMLYEQKIV